MQSPAQCSVINSSIPFQEGALSAVAPARPRQCCRALQLGHPASAGPQKTVPEPSEDPKQLRAQGDLPV